MNVSGQAETVRVSSTATQGGVVCRQAFVRVAERFCDLGYELDDHLKCDIVIERRLQPAKRRRNPRQRQRGALPGVREPGIAGTGEEHL